MRAAGVYVYQRTRRAHGESFARGGRWNNYTAPRGRSQRAPRRFELLSRRRRTAAGRAAAPAGARKNPLHFLESCPPKHLHCHRKQQDPSKCKLRTVSVPSSGRLGTTLRPMDGGQLGRAATGASRSRSRVPLCYQRGPPGGRAGIGASGIGRRRRRLQGGASCKLFRREGLASLKKDFGWRDCFWKWL